MNFLIIFRRVSYGEMVGCENPDCEIEWFHFPCVNLTSTVSFYYLVYFSLYISLISSL